MLKEHLTVQVEKFCIVLFRFIRVRSYRKITPYIAFPSISAIYFLIPSSEPIPYVLSTAT